MIHSSSACCLHCFITASCLLPTASCLLLPASCLLPPASCFLLPASCSLASLCRSINPPRDCGIETVVALQWLHPCGKFDKPVAKLLSSEICESDYGAFQ